MSDRILHLRCSRGLYGAEQAILGLARCCDQQLAVPSALAVLVDLREPHRELLAAARAEGLHAWELTSRSRFDHRTLQALAHLLERWRPGILHAHGYKAQVLAWLTLGWQWARGGHRCPLVVTQHGDTAQDSRVRAYEAAARGLLQQMDAVITVSTASAEALRGRTGACPLFTIPNGLDVARLEARVRLAAPAGERPDPPTPVARTSPEPELTILAVGRLSPEKDHALLLEAVSRLPAPRPWVVILGDGPRAGALRELAQRIGVRLELPGFCPDPAPWWARADLFCQPSRREGLPLAVLEAMAAGLPVIATSVGELPTVLAGVGRLVAPGAPDELTQALTELCGPSGWQLRRTLGQAGRQRVREQYDLLPLARRTVREVYDPLRPVVSPG